MEKIDRYFLEEECPFSKRRKIKTKNAGIALGVLLGGGVLLVLIFGGPPKEPEAKPSTTGDSLSRSEMSAATQSFAAAGAVSAGSDDALTLRQISGTRSSVNGASRPYNASQIVKPDTQAAAASGEGRLPLGTLIPAKLSNTVLSSDPNAPIIGLIEDDVLWENEVVIPQNTQAFGQGSLDETSERLQVRFYTLVTPEGEEFAFSGLALLADGSSGLTGEFSSGNASKQTGRFVGTFIGGLADGMKERRSAGMGVAFEPGSLKNGLLNGVADSASDQAKYYAERLQGVRPMIRVRSGSSFLIYLDRRF